MFRQTTLCLAALVFAAACTDQQLNEPTRRVPNARASFDGEMIEPNAALDTLRGFVVWPANDDDRQGDAMLRTIEGDFVGLVGEDAITLARTPGQEVWVVGHFANRLFYLAGYELRGDNAPACGNASLRDALHLPQLCMPQDTTTFIPPDSLPVMVRKPF